MAYSFASSAPPIIPATILTPFTNNTNMIETKAVITSQTVSWSGIHFYVLRRDATAIHLTFHDARHQQALQELQPACAVAIVPPATLATDALLALLRDNHSFAEYNESPFIIQATPFQRQVWQALCTIGFGTTATYGEIAAMLGNKNLARAVGQACGANPIAILIPCHRVVAGSGIGGFAGGPEIKKRLLALEKEAHR